MVKGWRWELEIDNSLNGLFIYNELDIEASKFEPTQRKPNI